MTQEFPRTPLPSFDDAAPKAASARDSEPLSGHDEAFGFGDGVPRNHGDRVASPGDVPLACGDRVAGVRIVRPLAAGGMGQVYEAWDPETRRTVAVKVLQGGSDRRRFVREARVLAALRHPHIAQLYALGRHESGTGSEPCLVMELVDSALPITAFADARNLSVRQRVALFRQVCAGMAHAHAAGVVHRDLKPANILVDAQGVAKVIDFGAARSGSDDGSFATAAGDLVGTLQYMSPEQLTGDADAVDARSDVYALGLVLHELVAGGLPEEVRAATYAEAVRRLSATAAPSTAALEQSALAECGRDDARSLAVIAASCREARPEDRYRSAAALEADLGRWLEGRPIRARPPTVLESLRRLVRRHRRATAAAAGVAATVLVLLATIGGLSVRERRQRHRADTARATAERQRTEAELFAEAARRELYFSTVRLAAAAVERHNVPEAARLLATATTLVPPDGGSTPIELACLEASLDDSLATLAAEDRPMTAVAAAHGLVAWAAADGRIGMRAVDDPGEPASPGGALHPCTGSRVWRLALSPDGSRLVAASASGAVTVLDPSTAATVATLDLPAEPVYACRYSADGTMLVTAGRDGCPRLWDTAAWQLRRELRGHRGTVYGACLSADGRVVATAGHDRTVRLWSAANGRQRRMLEGHEARVFDVAMAPDGAILATASEDGTARVWDVSNGREMTRLRHPERVNAVEFVENGRRLATAAGDGLVRVWDLPSGREALRLHGHAAAVWSLAAVPGTSLLATASEDGTARLWDLAGTTGPVLRAGGRVLASAHSADGRLLAAGLDDGTVVLWDARSYEQIGRLADADAAGRVNDVAFSPDGRSLAAGRDDGSVGLWNLDPPFSQHAIRPHGRRVYSVAFSSDGRRLLTASEDGTARVWDRDTDSGVGPVLRHGRRVLSAALSPDGTVVATGGDDRMVRLWRAADGTPGAVLQGHDAQVNWVAFAPHGGRLASGSSDGTVRLWRMADGGCDRVLRGPARQVWKVAFSPDSTRVAAVSADGTLQVWDARSGHAALAVSMGGFDGGPAEQAWAVTFAPDSGTLVAGSWDGCVRLFGLSAAEFARRRGRSSFAPPLPGGAR